MREGGRLEPDEIEASPASGLDRVLADPASLARGPKR
jgi:hypothetical protein